MLGENIKRFRRAKGISQEELAVKLNVVRQTISKWEKGQSVPDADVLIHIAQLLDVSVSQLLGIVSEHAPHADYSEELAQLNEQLAKKNQKEKLLLRANKKRGIIFGLSFLAMLIALVVRDAVVSALLAGVCVLSAVIVLYRNLALLTSITTDDLRIGVLRLTTFFNIGVLIVGIVFAILTALDLVVFSENSEKMFAMALVSCVILFAGIISPKLPYTKHTGLRLPWTVQDEDTWNIAHRIIGYISLPIVLLYIACSCTIYNFEMVTLGTMIAWIGIPGGLSYMFFRRKMYGLS